MSSKVINHFKKADPVLHKVLIEVVKIYGDKIFVLKKSENFFYDLCESIVSQQLSVKAGDTIFRRVLNLLPGKVLSPENILKTDDDSLKSAGLSNAKVKYFKDLAEKIKKREINLEILDNLKNEEVIFELTKVKGIGKWTAEMFLMSSLGREDIFSHGDLGLQNAIKKLYKLQKYDPKIADEFVVKWSPYRTIACRVLWRSLEINQVDFKKNY